MRTRGVEERVGKDDISMIGGLNIFDMHLCGTCAANITLHVWRCQTQSRPGRASDWMSGRICHSDDGMLQ